MLTDLLIILSLVALLSTMVCSLWVIDLVAKDIIDLVSKIFRRR